MDATGNSVEAFFREYEQGALATCFASTFLYAGPEGAQAMDLGVFTRLCRADGSCSIAPVTAAPD